MSNLVQGVATVTYQGSAPSYPVLTLTANNNTTSPRILTNWTTGKNIWFTDGFVLRNGETITIDFTPDNFSAVSSFRGSILNYIEPGSDLTSFALVPGVNNIGFYAANGVTSYLSYSVTHWSFDAAAIPRTS